MLADTVSSVNLTDARERSDVPLVLRRFILMTVMATVFFINADSGAFGPALLQMEQDLDISAKDVAILNGTTFFVCGALTILTSPIMNKYEARSVMILCAFGLSIGTFMFISSNNYTV